MSGVSKLTAERNQRVLHDLLTKPGNDVCADCKARNPRWASHNLGIFICVNCASIHRKIGTHISKIKSVTLDSWTKEQVETMKSMGNLKSNAIYNPNETRYPPPPALADPENDTDLESYIRSKYQYKKFIDKVAFVTLKLGPSRKTATPPPIPDSTSIPSSINKPTANPRPQPPQRPSTNASAPSAVPPAQQRKDGVWTDLISLNEPPRAPSLPLQYQVPATPTGAGMGVNMTSNAFMPPLQMAAIPIATPSYQTSFPQTFQTPGFSSSNVMIPAQPMSAVQTGYLNIAGPVAPQLQQQFLQPQPTSAGPPLFVPQPMVQQPLFTTPSPAILSTPSPAIGSFVNPSPQLSFPSPGTGYVQSQTTLTVSQPGVMMTGAPQVQMSMPMQTGMVGLASPVQVQSPLGYTTGFYQAQTGFTNTGHHQWGPL
ncbi:hypothetical protein F5887DRAFT_1277745 [Amanita rubescens]|nr:hypothetical protein F5887DRAFT_1277745 [Amanita rubescens]